MPAQPEFFLDRGLGRRVAEDLSGRPYGAVLFYLDNQCLMVIDMVRRFHDAQGQIYRGGGSWRTACLRRHRQGNPGDVALSGWQQLPR
ncbi:MAG: hypothetical protein GEV28_36355 [Actinophytocola sp.]|uniref:hypothetical protein n=1 Tax=Actinophytocola sp. TaxID=1872138 RepID=UPI00132822A2|nr:hypothetical protein [Actinophytocola sp.]MPZ85563.1 hypothetical protein [Actinophytocola sp.]